MQGKKIVLGITGSIACYKSADLASKLTQAGAHVDVILTASAQHFVTPLTFRSVTGRHTYSDLWAHEEHVQHVSLGENADLLVIAPATAHTIAKLANGLADNLLTVTALAARCPLLIAPAMDGGMFSHPSVQANLTTLKERGAIILGPAEGRMASGLVGKGRMLESAEIFAHIRLALAKNGALAGKCVLITAGPTQEPVDPVRYLTNRSSGKQGIALAQAALDMGAQVTLITGLIQQPLPLGAIHLPVRTAQEMAEVVLANVGEHDLLVMAAAVADFRPKTTATHKIKKSGDTPSIELERTTDILQTVKQWRTDHPEHKLVVVGFAAETNNVIAYATDKLHRKGLDLIAVNDVSQTNAGFAVDTNRITLIGKNGIAAELPLQSKLAVAHQILAQAIFLM